MGAPATTFAHLDATTVLSRNLAAKGIYPAVDPLDSTSTMLQPGIVTEEHYGIAEIFTGSPGEYVSLEDTIKGFSMLLNGELDDLPEQAFYLVGNLDQVIAKAETLK